MNIVNIKTETIPEAASLVCPNCKLETGRTREYLLNNVIVADFNCPNCDHLVFSCVPEIKKTTYTVYSGTGGTIYDDYD